MADLPFQVQNEKLSYKAPPSFVAAPLQQDGCVSDTAGKQMFNLQEIFGTELSQK